MKRYILVITLVLFNISCFSQNSEIQKEEYLEKQKTITEQPKGDWKVEKEFDEDGNLI